MKRKLLALPDDLLFRIGRDYSIIGTREHVATELTEYFKAYSLRWADVAYRYGIEPLT
jgi:hypothetical protein